MSPAWLSLVERQSFKLMVAGSNPVVGVFSFDWVDWVGCTGRGGGRQEAKTRGSSERGGWYPGGFRVLELMGQAPCGGVVQW